MAHPTSNPLPFSDALSMVLSHAAGMHVPGSERVPLLAARGRVLAGAVVADRDQPPFDRATRDGFAIQASAQGKELTMIGEVRAGEFWAGQPLAVHQAIEIMTGAPLPFGADCVAMIEHVLVGKNTIRLQPGRTLRAGENFVPAGSEAHAGEVLLAAGTVMQPAQIALAAACGCAVLDVFQKPRVAVMATGDELVPIEAAPLPQQIRNSNTYSLAALVEEAGAQAVPLPVSADTREALLKNLQAARDCDLLLLSGGVSAGKYDLVAEVLRSLGAEFLFKGVAMQPGRPVVFGRLPATTDCPAQYFFGLPGNPISTEVTFLLFVAPLLSSMCGAGVQQPRFVQATLLKEIGPKPGLTRFLPALLTHDLTRPTVEAVAWLSSGDLAANARANCYAVIPPDQSTIAAGTVITVLLR